VASTPDGVQLEWPTRADDVLHAEVHRLVSAVVELGGAVGWLHVPDAAECAAWLGDVLDKVVRGRGALVVVRRAVRVEALGMWLGLDAPVFAQNAEIRRVMVHPDSRGGGLARVVMEGLAASAQAAGVEVLRLGVRGNNHVAQALYESLGWVEAGRIPDFIGVGDERWDDVTYYLDFPRPDGVRRHGSAPVGAGSSGREQHPAAGSEV